MMAIPKLEMVVHLTAWLNQLGHVVEEIVHILIRAQRPAEMA